MMTRVRAIRSDSPKIYHFDGETFSPEADGARLSRQLDRVKEKMRSGDWHTLSALAASVEASEASVSARIRDLRKPRNGGYTVLRRRVAGIPGLWEYKLEGSEEVCSTV
jgi:biotin operon repressor